MMNKEQTPSAEERNALWRKDEHAPVPVGPMLRHDDAVNNV
jgi:hypothetical protein